MLRQLQRRRQQHHGGEGNGVRKRDLQPVGWFQWAYWITTSGSASGTGTITVNFAKSGPQTYIGLVKLTGNNTTTPIVTSNEATTNGRGSTSTANLTNTPASGDGGLVLLSGAADLGGSAPTATPAMTNLLYSHGGSGSIAIFDAFPASKTESFSQGNATWGSMALEIAHP